MSTFITRLDHAGPGPRIAVKDLIDVRGVPTTAGGKAVADAALPAVADAACMAGARAVGAAIVGKANLCELAAGASGTNPWYGTPANPLDPELVPGGSSSGSAVAVADGEADYGYGTDTGGSVRIPAAFCGLAGLKTTHGRVSLDGVWPLSPSLDTVGPIAVDVAGLVAAMALLEPAFTQSAVPVTRLGRLRGTGEQTDPRIDAAIDAVLARTGIETVEVELPDWQVAVSKTYLLLTAEAAAVNLPLLADPARASKVSAEVHGMLVWSQALAPDQIRAARDFQARWQSEWTALFSSVDAVVLPTVPIFPPPLTEASQHHYSGLTAPVNLAGLPALALPVPSAYRLPASLQVVGPRGGEETLLATGALIESAAGYRRPHSA